MARKLYLMVGAPACGKSTWIKQNDLEPYAIHSDVVRQFASAPDDRVDADGNFVANVIDQSDEHFVWDTIYEMVKRRMQQGETTIVDATHLFRKAFKAYDDLRIQYGYDVYIIDCMKPLVDKYYGDMEEVELELVERDKHRRAAVGKAVIQKYIGRWTNLKVPDWITYTTSRDFRKTLAAKETDMSAFDTIQVIGDIHGDYGALMKVFDQHHKGTAYVFVGDYLDRGHKNVETFDFLTKIGGNNLFFLKGNHETHYQQWLVDGQQRGMFGRQTLTELCEKHGGDDIRKRLKEFASQLKPYCYFKFGDKQYIVTHAGLEPADFGHGFNLETNRFTLKAGLMNESEFIMGVPGENGEAYSRDIDAIWGDSEMNLIQLHGHRNNFAHFDECKNTVNLTSDGEFRWVTITKDGYQPHCIKSIDGARLIDNVIADHDIKTMKVADGLYSHNFTREVFRDGRWTPRTIKARGLFSDGEDIVGRGFDKFFNVDENENATLDSLVYPVTAHKKYNGFLAITFWNRKLNKLEVMSKSGGERYSQLAMDVLTNTGNLAKLMGWFATRPQAQDTSVLFEIIDPINDPHIIQYDHPMAKPLAVIDNIEQGTFDLNGERYFEIAQRNEVFTARNKEELKTEISQYMEEKPLTEGLVLRGQNKLLKIKTPFYLKAKELRGAIGSGGKKMWYHGAKDWYHTTQKMGINQFTPHLAYALYQANKEVEDRLFKGQLLVIPVEY